MTHRAIYVLLALAAAYAAACVWSASWIDERTLSEQPGRQTLRAARALWSVSPRFNAETDAERALKLSWLTATAEVNSNRHDFAGMMKVLEREFGFTAAHYAKHLEAMSGTLARRYMTQLLTYLNRVELFRQHPAPALEARFRDFDPEIAQERDRRLRQDWHREMMIRAWLKGDRVGHRASREALILALETGRARVRTGMSEGIVALYDGLLHCIAGEPGPGAERLAAAARSLARYPRRAAQIVRGNLNVLLLARAMQEGKACEGAIKALIHATS